MSTETAEVVVVGAGVVGASIAFHLAAHGCQDVLVLERRSDAGMGSTARATGGFRAQFASAVNVRLSLLAREKLRRFPDEVGADPGYRECGYLFLARSEEELAELERAREVQRAAGLADARRISVEEAAEINPAVCRERLVGGVFSATDGFIRPLQILGGYRRAAQRLGVRFSFGAPVHGFRMGDGGRVAAVRTPGGEVAAGSVVNAAGAWAAQVAAFAGVELPVAPLCRQVATTRPTALLPEEMPMTIFTEDGFHLRVRDGRVLLLWPDEPAGDDPFTAVVREEWLRAVVAKAHARVPVLREVEIDRAGCWAGLYEVSPDRHAILGRAPGVENLYLANGSSGHGVMHAPALGHLLAEIVLDGTTSTLDVRPLRPSRFAEGEPNRASVLL